jgi:hypothetical protein
MIDRRAELVGGLTVLCGGVESDETDVICLDRSVMTDSGADRDFLSEPGVSAQWSSWAIGVNLLGPARQRP